MGRQRVRAGRHGEPWHEGEGEEMQRGERRANGDDFKIGESGQLCPGSLPAWSKHRLPNALPLMGEMLSGTFQSFSRRIGSEAPASVSEPGL